MVVLSVFLSACRPGIEYPSSRASGRHLCVLPALAHRPGKADCPPGDRGTQDVCGVCPFYKPFAPSSPTGRPSAVATPRRNWGRRFTFAPPPSAVAAAGTRFARNCVMTRSRSSHVRNGDSVMAGRFSLGLMAGLLAGLVVLGCNQKPPANVQGPQPAAVDAPWQPVAQKPSPAQPGGNPPPTQDPNLLPVDYTPTRPLDLPPATAPQLSDQEKYDAGLLDALDLINDGKLSEALAALEAARAVQ